MAEQEFNCIEELLVSTRDKYFFFQATQLKNLIAVEKTLEKTRRTLTQEESELELIQRKILEAKKGD
jgi:hypothetical protein